jgi:molecular chaperone GrpE
MKKKRTEDSEVDDLETLDGAGDSSSEDVDFEGNYQQLVKTLRAEKTALHEEKTALLEDLQRTRADFLNSKRRLEEQFKSDRDRIVRELLEDFLPLLDGFDTALAHSEGGDQALRKGIEVMRGQFLSILRRYDVTEMTALGTTFDPLQHEAVAERPCSSEEAPHQVVTVLQKGYVRGGTVIRPAKVEITS